MSIISLGDLAQSFMLRRHNADLKTNVARLAQEVTTGQVADAGKHLSGDVSVLTGIDSTLARLGGYARAASDAAFFTGAMQTAMTAVQDLASDLAPTMLSVASGANVGSIQSTARAARQAFETTVGLFNTRVGDRAIFAGVETSTSPLVPADQLLQQMETAVAGALTVQDVETALDTWFNSPTGFVATAYQGGGALADLPIGPGEKATIDVTAADPAIRETLKALGMAAMLDRGMFSGSPTLQASTLRRAGEAVAQGQNSRALMAGRLGITEGQIDTALTRNSAETSSLQIARTGLLAVDPYEAAAKLQAAQGQLETLYTITARLSRLNLVDFLR
jgi:flagellar hook-associated protein 3 FlgL